MTDVKGCGEWKPFIAMVAIDFSFAIVNILLKKVLDEGMNHLVLITYRLTIATIFLAPVSYFGERNTRPKLTLRITCFLFLSAILGTSLTQYFFLLGIQYTSATFACAFVNMVPVITFIMALPFGLEKVNLKCHSGRAKVLGTLVCIGGAFMLTLYKGVPLFDSSKSTASTQTIDHGIQLRSTRNHEGWAIGSIALVGGTLLWSSWFLVQTNISKMYPCQYSSTTIMNFFGAIQSAILGVCTGRNLSMWVLRGRTQVIAVLFSKLYNFVNPGYVGWPMQYIRFQEIKGMIASGLGFVGMSWCVRKRGPVFTAAFSPLVQIMVALIGIPIFHELLHLGSLLGSIVVIVGLYTLLWGKKKEMQKCATKLVQESEAIKEQEPHLPAITVSVDSRCP